jgi:hypothetical protein
MNFWRSLGREAERVAVALQIEEQLGAEIVFPLAGVDRAAAQPHDHGQVLDADRTLKLAGAAGGALEQSFFGNMHAQERRFGGGPEFLQVAAQAQNNFLGVEHLAGVVGRTMLGTAAALHAGEGLQRVDARDVLAGVESEILVARERRNAAEARALQEDRHRTERQVQMLRVRNHRQESEQRRTVCSHQLMRPPAEPTPNHKPLR